MLVRGRSRLRHKPDYRLGWSSEYVKKSMYACRSVSVACRPAEKPRRRDEIGSIHRSILGDNRRPIGLKGLIQLMQTMSHPSSLASWYQFILLGEQEHTRASEARSELSVRKMKSVSRLEPGLSGSDRAPISRTQEAYMRCRRRGENIQIGLGHALGDALVRRGSMQGRTQFIINNTNAQSPRNS